MLRRSPAYILPLLVAFAIATLVGLAQPRALADLRNLVFDIWQREQPRAYDADGPVRIVAVDEASLARLGQWPWPRSRIAEATRRLTELGAAAIAFDIIFSEPDRTSLETLVPAMPESAARDALAARLPDLPTNDALFAQAIAQGPVVLGATFLATGAPHELPAKTGIVVAGDDPAAFVPAFQGVAAPLPALAQAARGIGATNWLPDRDQVIRRVPLLVREDARLTPSLAIEALRVAEGASTLVIRASNASGQAAFGQETGINALKVGDREIATGASGEVRPLYSSSEPSRFISFARLLDGQVARDEIEGRIVLVGTTAIGLGDVRATPLDAAVPGVEIQAQIVESLVAGAILARPDWAPGGELAAALTLFLVVAFALPWVSPLASALVVLALMGACAAGSYLAFERARLLIDPAYPALTMAGAYVFGTLSLWRSERVSRKRVRNAFGKFLAPAVVDRLAADPRGLVLGGETRELTIMFCDLRNFSGISEGLDAPALTAFMNAYLTPMTDAILDCEGTVDKYIGDAIVAFWNAPLDVERHTARAVEAALRMRAELAAFNTARAHEARDMGQVFVAAAQGIGLNAGPCTVGNMGSLRRFDYSVLGDTVNLASRLEGVSKLYGVDLVAADAVVRRAPDFAWLELDRVRVKGRSEPTTIHGLAGDRTLAASPAFARWRENHTRMLARFRAGDTAAALRDAAELRDAAVPEWVAYYEAIAARFGDVALEPQPLGNDGVRVLESK